MTVEDLLGQAVGVGDTIAYGAVDGRSGMIRVGKVIEVVEGHTRNDRYWGDNHKVPTKLRVEVTHSSGWGKPEKPVLIQADFKRFVRLGNPAL